MTLLNGHDDFIASPCHESIEIRYQDSHILVINKPSGLLSLSGKNPLNKDSVHHRLCADYPTALMVHRLDFGTSGLMVIALSKAVVKHLNQQFSNRSVEKTYLAQLDGIVKKDHGEICFSIAKGEFPLIKICEQTGKPAQTQYQVLRREHKHDYTMVKFMPLTGRTHQLRVHSAAIGHPILGCDLYGTSDSFTKAPRLMLHASGLVFDHPETGERMTFFSDVAFV